MKQSTRLQRLEQISTTQASGRRRELVEQMIAWIKRCKTHEEIHAYVMTDSMDDILAFLDDAPVEIRVELAQIEARMAGLGVPFEPAMDEVDMALIHELTEDELRAIIAKADARGEAEAPR
jgi:hypothetical protein